MNKLETLKSALVARNDEIEGYQVNIDNYERAIAKIDTQYADNAPMVDFRNKLEEMLKTNKIEQLKAIIIRDVVADQITELEDL